MKKRLVAVISVVMAILIYVAPADALNKMWWATGRTGGGDALDGIDAANLAVGDGCIVLMEVATTDPRMYLYRVYDSGTAESDPLVIQPNTDTGAGHPNYRWHLVNIYGKTMQSPAGADGSNKITMTNNTTASATASTDEIYFEGNVLKINQNGTESAVTLSPTAGQVTLSGPTAPRTFTVRDSAYNLDSAVLVGTFASPITDNPYSLTSGYASVLFYGATGEVDLPAAVAGMNICIYNTGAFTITIDPNGSDVIVVDGTANAAGDAFTLSSGAGNYVCLIADAANHWVTMGYKGTLSAL